MRAEFRAVFHMGFFGVPDSKGAVGGAGGYEEAGWVPGEGAEAVAGC